MARKTSEIQQEYGQLCAQNGERHFQIKVMQAEIEKTEQRIIELGKEMQEAVAAEKAAAPKPEEKQKEMIQELFAKKESENGSVTEESK